MLLSEVYPSLRRVEFIVDFVEKPMTVEVARAMVLNNPQDLTIDHVYMVGQSYPKGSPEFEQVFVIAHQYHPNDPVVANNVAAVAMNKGDYATAKRHLERVANDPHCQNNLGVIAAWEGDHQKAEQHFRKAIEAGSSEAQYNLDNLASLRF